MEQQKTTSKQKTSGKKSGDVKQNPKHREFIGCLIVDTVYGKDDTLIPYFLIRSTLSRCKLNDKSKDSSSMYLYVHAVVHCVVVLLNLR